MAEHLTPVRFPADATGIPLQSGRVNRVFRIAHPHGDLVRRAHAPPALAQRLGVDVAVELRAQTHAAAVGLAPEVLHHDATACETWMPFVEGAPLEARWWLIDQRRKSLADALAVLRGIDPGEGIPRLDLAERLAELQSRLIARDRAAARQTQDSFDTAVTALNRYNWAARASLCLVHGDFGPHNVLVRANGAIVILDWEYAHVGHVLEDYAGLWVTGGEEEVELRRWVMQVCATLPGVDDPVGRLDALVMARRAIDAQWELLATD